MRKWTVIFCAMIVVTAVACKSKDARKPESNALKEYVNVPKEKANDAKKKLEGAQEKARTQALDALDAEEDMEDEGGTGTEGESRAAGE